MTVFFIACAVLVFSACPAHGSRDGSSSEWDFFVFVELSPGGDCYVQNNGLNCSHPPLTPNWTMHGIWPSSYNQSDNPQYCNTSMSFNVTLLKDLLPSLKRVWPTLMSPRTWDKYCPKNITTYMWCHEWMRHGTCAAEVAQMSTELGFFSTVLTLFEHRMNYDTFVLAKYGVVPSKTQSYKLEDFVSAFVKWGVHPVLNCDIKDEKQILISISTCMAKDFSLMKCPDSIFGKRNCYSSHPIFYFPT